MVCAAVSQSNLGSIRVSGLVWCCVAARIWSCVCLPANRRAGRHDCAMAARRHCLCETSTPARRLPVEYRSRPARQRSVVSVVHLLLLFVIDLHWKTLHPDFYHFVLTICFINGALLFSNLIPVYPLDGGQIVRGLLWLKFGTI